MVAKLLESVGWAAPLVLIFLAFSLDLRVALRSEPSPIDRSEMTRLTEVMRAERKAGDVLVHSPLFRVSELAAFGDLPARPDRPADDVQQARRVLVADLRDAPMRGFIGKLAKVVPVSDHLELRLYEPEGGAEPLLFDLFDQYRSAKMWIERPPGTKKSTCDRPRAEGGFSCPGEADWLYLSPRTLRVSGASADCVWAHPTTGGIVVIELPVELVPEGRRVSLILEAALDDSAVGGDGVPVENLIRQGERELGRVIVPNRVGWFRGTFELEPGQPVEIRISTANDGRRHHCVRARIQERAGP
jgi:hypothetical protein